MIDDHRSENTPYVVLRHDRAGQRGWIKPYHIDPLRRYCAKPPGNPAFKLMGIYASERAALTAMDADWKVTRKIRKEARP